MMYSTALLLWMAFTGCSTSPLGSQRVKRDTAESIVLTTGQSADVIENDSFDFLTEIYPNITSNNNSESDLHSGNSISNSSIDAEINQTKVSDQTTIPPNNGFVNFDPATNRSLHGTFGFIPFGPHGIVGLNLPEIMNRFNGTFPGDVLDRQTPGSSWLTDAGNLAFGQPFGVNGYPYGINNGYGTGYIYPPGSGVWPGGVGNGFYPGNGYSSYPYGGITNGYGYMGGYGNLYGNAYPPGYDFWNGMGTDSWFWRQYPRSYWNSQLSWG